MTSKLFSALRGLGFREEAVRLSWAGRAPSANRVAHRRALRRPDAGGIYTYIHMAVTRVRTFRSGNSEAVRLPKDIAFGEDVELVAVRSGDVLTLYPSSLSIAEMVRRLAALPAPPTIEERDDIELPEPAGL